MTQMLPAATTVSSVICSGWPGIGTSNSGRLRAPPTATFIKIAKPTASAACEPQRAKVKKVQPHRKLTSRPYARRRYTYSPPASGVIAATSE